MTQHQETYRFQQGALRRTRQREWIPVERRWPRGKADRREFVDEGRWLLLLPVLLLLPQVTVGGELRPFGWALVAALLPAAGERTRLLAGTLLAGDLLAQGWQGVLPSAVFLALAVTAVRLQAPPAAAAGEKTPREPGFFRELASFVPSLAIFAAAALGQAVTPGLLGEGVYGLVEAVAQGALVAVLAQAWRRPLGSRLVPVEHSVEHSPEEADRRDEILGWAILVAAVLAALRLIDPGGFGLGPGAADALAALAVLAAASLGAAAAASITGLAVGAIMAVSGGAGLVLAGIYGFSGILAGAFYEWGKAGVLAGFLVAQSLILLPAGYAAWSSLYLFGTLSGALLFAILPAGLWQRVARWAALPLPVGTRAELVSQERQSTGLAGVTERKALEEVAEVCRELAASLAPLPGAGKKGPGMRAVVEAAAQEACPGCSAHKICWGSEFLSTYHNFGHLYLEAESQGAITLRSFQANRRVNCLRPDQLAVAINHLAELHRHRRRWDSRLAESRQLMADQLRALADISEQLRHRQRANGSRGPAGPRSRLTHCTGVAKLARAGRLVSGDSHRIRELDDRLILVLSDGMGVGTRAAMESGAAVGLLERLLETGVDQERAIGMVNSILFLRSGEDVFTTLDLAVVDLLSGQAEFVKIGAVPTFIKRGRHVWALKAGTVPLGILQEPDMARLNELLEAGDVVVMVSDGVSDGGRSPGEESDWLIEFLGRQRETEPRSLANRILDEALVRVGEATRDDMTVMVTRLEPR